MPNECSSLALARNRGGEREDRGQKRMATRGSESNRWETVEILEWVARRGRRADGKERGRRIPGAGCNDRATRSAECFRGQLPFCLAPSTVALILALAGVARWAEIAADIGAALRVLANAKIHSNATHSSSSTVS